MILETTINNVEVKFTGDREDVVYVSKVFFGSPIAAQAIKNKISSDSEPTKEAAERAVYSAEYRFAPIYVESITETSESEIRGKEYILVGAK